MKRLAAFVFLLWQLYLHQVFGSENRGFIGVNLGLPWLGAQEYCQTFFGTSLATITTNTSNDALREIAANIDVTDVWIGANSLYNGNKNYSWIDGTGFLDTLGYSRWTVNEPNNEDTEYCGEQQASSTWNNFVCEQYRAFACNDPNFIITNYNETAISYDEAQEYCSDHYNTSLATITSVDSNDAVYSLINEIAMDVDVTALVEDSGLGIEVFNQVWIGIFATYWNLSLTTPGLTVLFESNDDSVIYTNWVDSDYGMDADLLGVVTSSGTTELCAEMDADNGTWSLDYCGDDDNDENKHYFFVCDVNVSHTVVPTSCALLFCVVFYSFCRLHRARIKYERHFLLLLL